MKLETYLGKNLGKFSAFQEIMAIAPSQLADVSMPIDKQDIVVGRLNMFEKRLLTLIKFKMSLIESPSDYYMLSMLTAILFAGLVEKYIPIDGTAIVIRQNHTVCVREISEDAEYFALVFDSVVEDGEPVMYRGNSIN